MKTPILLLLFFLSYNVYAQKPLFVRVYDIAGKKIGKGQILAITDSSILLQLFAKKDTIEVRNIGSVRTKRAPGHNIGMGMLIGGVSGAIVGAIAGQSEDQSSTSSTEQWQYHVSVVSPAEASVLGLALGLFAGAAVGTISCAAKQSKTVLINGDYTKWKTFQALVAAHNARHQKQ